MSTGLKTKMWGTLVVATIITGFFYMVQRPPAHTSNGHKETGKMLLLSINFSGAPRDPQVHIAYKVGMSDAVQDWASGAWQETVAATSGVNVELGARQVQPGGLFCSIRQGDKVLAFDHNLDGSDFVACLAVAP